MAGESSKDGSVRLDQWLHAARFFKTRSRAAAAIRANHVLVDGSRVKPSRPVAPGNALSIVRGDERVDVVIRGLSTRRGPAPVAQALYEETEESRARREARAEERRLKVRHTPRPDKRPDKRSRRHLIRFRRKSPGDERS